MASNAIERMHISHLLEENADSIMVDASIPFGRFAYITISDWREDNLLAAR